MKKNVMIRWIALLGLVPCVCFAVGLVGSQRQGRPTSKVVQTKVEYPAKLHHLYDLAQFDSDHTSSVLDKTEVLLRWLVEERRHPTPVEPGITGGPIDSYYIQRQIIETMVGQADARALRWLAKQGGISSELRRVLLLQMNDHENPATLEATLNTLLHDPNPYLRAYAARSLNDWDGEVAEQALEIAANDPFVLEYRSAHHLPQDPNPEPAVRRWYPVREMAREALRNRASEDGCPTSPHRLEWVADRQKLFQGYEDFVREHQAELQRLLAIAMSDSPDKMNLIQH